MQIPLPFPPKQDTRCTEYKVDESFASGDRRREDMRTAAILRFGYDTTASFLVR